jgi:hypothetical protein
MTKADDIEPTRAGFAETARQRAIEAYENARGGVAGAGRKATGGLKEAPLIALAKARALAWPAGLFFAALLVAQSAVTVLAVGIYVALYWIFGPVLAGLVAFLLFAALAGGLAWYALQRLGREL